MTGSDVLAAPSGELTADGMDGSRWTRPSRAVLVKGTRGRHAGRKTLIVIAAQEEEPGIGRIRWGARYRAIGRAGRNHTSRPSSPMSSDRLFLDSGWSLSERRVGPGSFAPSLSQIWT
jgi:hypothetical protein